MPIDLHVVFSKKYLKNLCGQKILSDEQISTHNELHKLARFNASTEGNLVKAAAAFTGYPEIINEIFTNYFGAIGSYLQSIEEIIEREEVSSKAQIIIHLYGGYDEYNFSMINGIGEGKTFFLRKEDIYNKYIFEQFAGRYLIKWHSKRSKLTGYLYCLRGFLLFFSMLCFQTLKVFRKKATRETSINLIIKEINLENSQPQKYFFEALSHKPVVNVNEFSLNSMISLLKCMRDGFRSTKNNFPSNFTYGGAIRGNMTLFLSLLHMQTKANILFAQLKPLANLKKIRTAMTYGNDISVVHKFCKANRIDHVNFQAVGLRRIYFPNHDIADRYYILDESVKNFYCNKFKNFRFLKPARVFRHKISGHERAEKEVVISFFTQPEEYSSYIKTFIEEFLCDLPANIRVNIKPHYRENGADYQYLQGFAKKTIILPPSKSSCDIIKQSTLVLAINSFVLKEAACICDNAVRLDILESNNDNYLFSNIPTVNSAESLRLFILRLL